MSGDNMTLRELKAKICIKVRFQQDLEEFGGSAICIFD